MDNFAKAVAANSTHDVSNSTYKVNIFYAIFIPSFCVVTTIANLATLIAFYKVPELWQKPSEVLILSLSCADLGTGLLVLPLWSPVYITPGRYPFGEGVCGVFIFLLNVTVNASLLSLLNISIDRFLLVYKEYPQYLKMQSKKRVVLAIIISWSIAIMTGVVEISMWNIAKTLDFTAAHIDYTKTCLSPARRVEEYSLTLFIVFYFTPAILMCLFSVAFLYFLRKRLVKSRTRGHTAPGSKDSAETLSKDSMEMHSNTSVTHPKPATPAERNHQKTRNRYIKPAITLIALVSAMAVCMLPYCFYVLAIEGMCSTCAYGSAVLEGLLFLQFCNACLDPFLYAVTQRKIRQYYSKTLKMVKTYLCNKSNYDL